MCTPVHAKATPLSMCHVSSTYRDVCCVCCIRFDVGVTLCCPTSTTQYFTTFYCAKMHGLDRYRVVMMWQVEFGIKGL